MCDYTGGEPMSESRGKMREGALRNLTSEEILKHKYDQALANLEREQAYFELLKWAKIAVMAAPLTPKARSLLIDKL